MLEVFCTYRNQCSKLLCNKIGDSRCLLLESLVNRSPHTHTHPLTSTSAPHASTTPPTHYNTRCHGWSQWSPHLAEHMRSAYGCQADVPTQNKNAATSKQSDTYALALNLTPNTYTVERFSSTGVAYSPKALPFYVHRLRVQQHADTRKQPQSQIQTATKGCHWTQNSHSAGGDSTKIWKPSIFQQVLLRVRPRFPDLQASPSQPIDLSPRLSLGTNLCSSSCKAVIDID